MGHRNRFQSSTLWNSGLQSCLLTASYFKQAHFINSRQHLNTCVYQGNEAKDRDELVSCFCLHRFPGLHSSPEPWSQSEVDSRPPTSDEHFSPKGWPPSSIRFPITGPYGLGFQVRFTNHPRVSSYRVFVDWFNGAAGCSGRHNSGFQAVLALEIANISKAFRSCCNPWGNSFLHFNFNDSALVRSAPLEKPDWTSHRQRG